MGLSYSPQSAIILPILILRGFYLHPIRHRPPLPHLGVSSHALHIALEICTDVFERGEEGALIVEENGVCRIP